ncbi:MAG TPA: hypothetical protein VLC91_00135, partial [Spongiibacteraceae bacterium]|nr:hypothetical protein [Spongiibacteraceae bacterium]
FYYIRFGFLEYCAVDYASVERAYTHDSNLSWRIDKAPNATQDKRTVLKLVFAGNLTYVRNLGLQPPTWHYPSTL